ncbi:hypothetical protein TRFO_10126 [Tritrichomonas foetus]|uniref:Nucleotide-diphospho-sugar transferase domain-containing protein n=1 Tax=Tritrichomonas foetus TaxID=1144522 RepID=A0A1J4JAJ6_9EUKA|nr:hypothetical protein TRFO_10126 [Tritrichomonas foetus]|eukprot:OHS96194.1 hypothetical protein TRFO_10126 [Tritrichomonas foetus]
MEILGFIINFIILLFWTLLYQRKMICYSTHGIIFFADNSIAYLHDKYHTICVPFAQKKTFSTKRDLTITASFYGEKHLPLTLFSIRQSGCMATIVVLTNKEMKFSAFTTKLMNCLSVRVIGAHISDWLKKHHTDFIRDMFVCNFAKLYRNEFDRIFFFDAFDVFFEHDPFEYFEDDHIFFFRESMVPIRKDRWNKLWINSCYGDETLKRLGNNLIVCSGTVAGSINMFIKFYELIQKQESWNRCGADQGQINYAIYSGLLDRNNISYVLFDQAGPVHTLVLGTKHYKHYFNNSKYLYVTNAKDEVAAVLHQHKKVKPVMIGLYNRCNFTKVNQICKSDSSEVKYFQYLNLSSFDDQEMNITV